MEKSRQIAVLVNRLQGKSNARILVFRGARQVVGGDFRRGRIARTQADPVPGLPAGKVLFSGLLYLLACFP